MQQEAWGTALARAAGEKVYDDPKLLRKSLKKVLGGGSQGELL